MNRIINYSFYFISAILFVVFFMLYLQLKMNVPTSAWFVYPFFLHYVPSILVGTLLCSLITMKLIFNKKLSLIDLLNFLTMVIVTLLISFVNEIYILFATGAQILLNSFVLVYFGLYSLLFTNIIKKTFSNIK